jgi:serine O-acetyltransferase
VSAGASLGVLLRILLEDYRTHDRNAAEPGFWAVAVHRFGRFSRSIEPAPVRMPLVGLHGVLAVATDWLWGIHLPPEVELGRRVRLWHHGCMMLTARSIGDDVHLRQNTTFGPVTGMDSDPAQWPIIEDRADIGSGACVLGPVTVGHDAVVGANTVVLKDVAPGAVVMGVPARKVPGST